MWKPDGYPSVSPYLVTSRAADVVRFLERTLGATLLCSFERVDGSIVHAEIRLDDSVVMIGDPGYSRNEGEPASGPLDPGCGLLCLGPAGGPPIDRRTGRAQRGPGGGSAEALFGGSWAGESRPGGIDPSCADPPGRTVGAGVGASP